MLNMLAAAALAAATSPSAVAPPHAQSAVTSAANADPAIFVVRDADTTVYIFGTFHALDGKAEWFNDQVKTAFDQSNELVLETLIPEGPVKLPRPRPDPGHDVGCPFGLVPCDHAYGGQGGPLAWDEPRQWRGHDLVSDGRARRGSRWQGSKPSNSQLNMFSKMPPAPAARAPKAGDPVEPVNSLSKTMTDLQAAWRRGELNVFVRMLGQLEQSSPDTYRMMFTERNARWADWIKARMQSPGTIFVAVGAGHLAGKDSVLVRLAEHGIPSARVN